jgi:hypothetical protein
MARLISRPFDPTQPVYARRFFVAAGRHYNPGDHFDWQRLSVAQRRVFLLFEAGKLTHDAGTEAPAQKEEKPKPAPKPVEQEVQDDEILAAAAEPTPEPEEPTDELDDMNMKQLRAIAEAEGAPYRTSRDAQRQAIREHRDNSADA